MWPFHGHTLKGVQYNILSRDMPNCLYSKLIDCNLKRRQTDLRKTNVSEVRMDFVIFMKIVLLSPRTRNGGQKLHSIF